METKRITYGVLHIIVGPMFSGKSTELLRRLHRASIAKKVLLISPTKDTRVSSSIISSRGGAQSPCVKITGFKDIPQEEYNHAQVVGIDEAQFFDNGLVPFIINALRDGKEVQLSGLDADADGKAWLPFLELIPIALSVIKLTALCVVCNDGTEAPHTACKVDRTERILVGDEPYVALCGHHFHEHRTIHNQSK
jgi:thymidine kinase